MDGSAIVSAIQSFESAANIVKGLAGLVRDNKALSQINELQRTIFDANRNALAAQAEYRAALTRISELEKHITRLEGPPSELKNYELSEVSPGTFVYVVKPDAKTAAPPHWLCPNCFSNGHKSLLQHDAHFSMGQADSYRCPRCKNDISVGKGITPSRTT